LNLGVVEPNNLLLTVNHQSALENFNWVAGEVYRPVYQEMQRLKAAYKRHYCAHEGLKSSNRLLQP
jgi:hypothetical protein